MPVLVVRYVRRVRVVISDEDAARLARTRYLVQPATGPGAQTWLVPPLSREEVEAESTLVDAIPWDADLLEYRLDNEKPWDITVPEGARPFDILVILRTIEGLTRPTGNLSGFMTTGHITIREIVQGLAATSGATREDIEEAESLLGRWERDTINAGGIVPAYVDAFDEEPLPGGGVLLRPRVAPPRLRLVPSGDEGG
jgi:hypothetical protein